MYQVTKHRLFTNIVMNKTKKSRETVTLKDHSRRFQQLINIKTIAYPHLIIQIFTSEGKENIFKDINRSCFSSVNYLYLRYTQEAYTLRIVKNNPFLL